MDHDDVLTINAEEQDGVTIVRLSGELDSMNVGELTQTFAGLLEEGRRMFVLDMAGLDFIDSAGLGGLVASWERSVERGCFLTLGAYSPRVRDVLQITGLNSLLKPYDNIPDAVAAVREMEQAFPGKPAASAP